MVSQNGQTLSLEFNGDPRHVRRALHDIHQHLSPLSDTDLQTSTEITLAEVFNNIVKHAYRDTHRGIIGVDIATRANCLGFHIRDAGCGMPNGQLPVGAPHDLSDDVQTFPEGGFGWNLIHTLTENINYARQNDQNTLTFDIARTAT
ncbi:MAG: ATP-binding protein [Halocynthiibacter sp.]